MQTRLSQKLIGSRIYSLRRIKGLSQVELAKRISISRSSMTQIELGNRSVNVLEFYQLSQVLDFSLDDFVSQDFLNELNINNEINIDSSIVPERVSKPKLNIDKLKNVLLYILEKCAGKPNVGETVLYKLLYFCDFNYYETYEEHLTGASYRKLPFGPVPNKLNIIINQMIDNNKLQRIKTEFFGYAQTRYLPLIKVDLTQLKASETEIIDKVIEQMSDWSASSISNYSHKDLPWLTTKEGDEIDYELAFYRELPFSARNYENEQE